MSFMPKINWEEFIEILDNEVLTRWPKWSCSSKDHKDLYQALKDYSHDQLCKAIQDYRINEQPRRPNLFAIKKYLPRIQSNSGFTPKLTPQQYKNEMKAGRIISARKAIETGDQQILDFIAKIDPDAVEQARRIYEENGIDYSKDILERF